MTVRVTTSLPSIRPSDADHESAATQYNVLLCEYVALSRQTVHDTTCVQCPLSCQPCTAWLRLPHTPPSREVLDAVQASSSANAGVTIAARKRLTPEATLCDVAT